VNSQTPFVSVVVPTRDRPAALAACLAAIGRQRYPAGRVEVVVVDDGSACAAEVAGAVAGAGGDVRLHRQPHRGPAAARNQGARLARGQLLAFTDDDCQPHDGWLAALAAAWARDSECLLGGRTVNLLAANAYATASQLLVSYLYDYYNRDAGDAVFFASNNLAAGAEAYRDVGGFDAAFGLTAAEDRELCDRWRHLGRRLVYVPGAVVGHAHRLTLAGFLRQHREYGRGAVRYHHLRASRGRVRLEPARFYAGILRYPIGRVPARRVPVMSTLMAMSQAVGAAGYAGEMLRGRASSVRAAPRSGEPI
jgi:glycosyltransferase involved in cell wall biosynthesis